jgi:hypothetical protein
MCLVICVLLEKIFNFEIEIRIILIIPQRIEQQEKYLPVYSKLLKETFSTISA